tara:strand:- start:215 stop:676 length:462 start_codon:yes stop_codon:yes gene_type:complete
MLNVGDKAPFFSLYDSDLNKITSNDLKGKNYVLFFYPKDDTPGCTIESNEFSDLYTEFDNENTEIFGVSLDSSESHRQFRDKFKIKATLLADIDGALSKSYEVLKSQELLLKNTMKINRSTFIIDSNEIVRFISHNVSPVGHAREILAIVKNL